MICRLIYLSLEHLDCQVVNFFVVGEDYFVQTRSIDIGLVVFGKLLVGSFLTIFNFV